MLTIQDLYTELTLAELATRRFCVNVTISQSISTTARGTTAPRYAFTASGNGIGAATVTADASSPAAALSLLLSRVKAAYYAYRDEQTANDLARRGLTKIAA